MLFDVFTGLKNNFVHHLVQNFMVQLLNLFVVVVVVVVVVVGGGGGTMIFSILCNSKHLKP